MTYHFLTDKAIKIQHTCAVELSKCLELWLPGIFSEEWWSKGVVENLSEWQRRASGISSPEAIRNLNLETLLKVLSRNRNALLGRSMLQAADRTVIDSMFEVCNRWAHLALQAPREDVILKDLKTVSAFLAIIEAGNGSCREFRKEVESFAIQVRNEGITDIPAETMVQAAAPAIPGPTVSLTGNAISVGSIVKLKSNPTTKGMVKSVGSVDGKAMYNVFVDDNIRTFFEGQIEAIPDDASARAVSIDELHRSLTALYINRPSSDSLYSLGAAKIDFVPYQFRPALKLIRSDEPRLLIADSVGVGKTIEAGLIMKELQARSQLTNVLIICPKPLVAERKWENEMRDKFGEEFTPIDGGKIDEILHSYNRDGVWPEKYSRAIIPYSILRGAHMDGLVNLDSRPELDLVIVDEAHYIRNRPTQAYNAVSYLCERAYAVIFLTATPIQTDEENLFTLLNVLFPDKVIDGPTFTAMTEPNRYIYSAVRSLRLGEEHNREAIGELHKAAATSWGRSVIVPNPVYSQCISTLERGSLSRQERVKLIDSVESLNSLSGMINRTRRSDIEKDAFCKRDAITLRSKFTEHQQKLHDALIDFEAQILGILHGGKNINFMICTLRQQAASCIYGLAPSIESFTKRGIDAITDSVDDEIELVLGDNEITVIIKAAANLIELSHNLRDEDTKLEKLLEIIQKKQDEPNNKIILFTMFKHTQRYLWENITKRTGLRVGIVNGDVGDEERYELHEKFALDKEEKGALDIMLFTEVGSEGLDYQFCDTMVNYDLPWNPMRIEQRIGRIDRRGQKSEKVHIYNCITEGTLDADIYDRCLWRIGIFKENIGDCGDILGRFAEGIEKIVLNSELNPAERAEKLDKLADNEERHLLEIRDLKEKSKELLGIDISGFTESLNRADNPWLSTNAVRKLVEGYLDKRLNDGIKHLDGNMLRLNADAKVLIREDYDRYKFIDKKWQGYLRSNSAICPICFEQVDAKNDRKALFINATHAFARQAARFLANNEKMLIAISVSSSDVPSGTYPFSLYSWEYQSERPKVELVPVCENESLRGELLNFIQPAIQVELKPDAYTDQWENLELRHLMLWETARDKFRAEALELCRFKTESLWQSTQIKLRIAEARAIENIREGEIANINAAFNRKKAHLREAADRADIHFSLILNGVITIIGGQ